MTDRAELIARITSGSGQDQELDADIALFIVRQNYPEAYRISDDYIQAKPGLTISGTPDYLTSLDAIAAIPGANIVESLKQGKYWGAVQKSDVAKYQVRPALDRPRAELAAVLSDPDVGVE